MLFFGGCFLPGPQSASATPEVLARTSVPSAEVLASAAEVGQLFPGVSVPATVVDRFMRGYMDEAVERIAALDSRRAKGERVAPSDWWATILLSLGAGASNIIAYRTGHSNARRAGP